MYYCPNCKKKFRQYRRKCPDCGSICQHSNLSTILMIAGIVVVLALFVGLMILLNNRDNPASDNDSSVVSSVTTQSTAASSTASTSSTAPTETTVPPTTAPATQPTTQPMTAPSVPSGTAGIGMYTRAELEALDNTSHGYGPGNFLGRPDYAVSNQKRYEKYAANFIAPDNGNIYLTFDCGYEYYITGDDGKKIPLTSLFLDTLKEKNAKGVFFITMPYAKSEPELVQRMIDEGHVVGNHSNHHPVMPTLSIDEMEDEVMSLHNYVQEHFGYTMTLFRPPTGAFSERSLAVVQNLGYKTVHWSFAYADWSPDDQPDVDKSLASVLEKAHSGAIYLLHAVSETNATILGDAIDGFRQKGYKLELFQ